jgi:hypothetical protein
LVVLVSAFGAFGLALVTIGGGKSPESRKQESDILGKVPPRLETPTRVAQLTPSTRLVVESQRAFANEPMPLGIALNDASGGEMLSLAGLAVGTKLTAGSPRGETGWQVAARDLKMAFAHAPTGFIGAMDAVVDLRSPHDRLMDSQVIRLEWVEKKPVAALAPRRDPFAQTEAIIPLEAEEIATLLKRGQDFLKTGDIMSARLVLRRAANAGNGHAALALGATFDAVFLAQLGALGFAPDVAQARVWYQRALELGSTEASRRLDRSAGAEK